MEALKYINIIEKNKNIKSFYDLYESDEYNDIESNEDKRKIFYLYAFNFSSSKKYRSISDLFKDLKKLLDNIDKEKYLQKYDQECYITIINNYIDNIEIIISDSKFFKDTENYNVIRDIINKFKFYFGNKKEIQKEIVNNLEELYEILKIKLKFKVLEDKKERMSAYLKDYEDLINKIKAKINNQRDADIGFRNEIKDNYIRNNVSGLNNNDNNNSRNNRNININNNIDNNINKNIYSKENNKNRINNNIYNNYNGAVQNNLMNQNLNNYPPMIIINPQPNIQLDPRQIIGNMAINYPFPLNQPLQNYSNSNNNNESNNSSFNKRNEFNNNNKLNNNMQNDNFNCFSDLSDNFSYKPEGSGFVDNILNNNNNNQDKSNDFKEFINPNNSNKAQENLSGSNYYTNQSDISNKSKISKENPYKKEKKNKQVKKSVLERRKNYEEIGKSIKKLENDDFFKDF